MGKITNFLVGTLGIVAAVAMTRGIYRTNMYGQAWRKAAWVADAHGDNNKIISQSEYATIYQTLGLKDTGRSALDLSKEQLEKYVYIKRLEDFGTEKKKSGLGGLF